MDVRLLGPVEIHAARGDVVLTASRTRALLAILALRAGTTVSRDELIDAVWGDDPPPTAPKLVQIQISQLRRALNEAGEPDRIATRSAGYQLSVDQDELDVARAAALIGAAREALEQASPDGHAHAALRLWRGTPLEDLADGELGRRERARLAELR